MVFGKIVATAAISVLALAAFIGLNEFTPNPLELSPPPQPVGALARKALRDADKIAEGLVYGPESLVVENGAIYTCTTDAKCVKIVNGKITQTIRLISTTDCSGEISEFMRCGRPLGIRRWYGSKFLVADALYGIYAVDFENESVEIIFDAKVKVGGLAQKFPDDLDVYDNDTIIYSDASTKWMLNDLILPFLANGHDGRIIRLKLSTGEASVLVDNLSFPNGVQLHPDRESVIFAESVTATVHRYYFAGKQKGHLEVFCRNLPGFPDNIRPAADGKSFYVAMFGSRWQQQKDTTINEDDSSNNNSSSSSASIFDFLAPHIWLRKVLGVLMQCLPQPVLELILHSSAANYGIFVEVDLNGKIINSYHDPEGKVISETTQVSDDGEYLYLGSYVNKYIGRVRKY